VDADPGRAQDRSRRLPAEPRQRWRLVFRRVRDAPLITHRELVEGWVERLRSSGLPVLQAEGTRPKSPISFAAPLPVGMSAERELADLNLVERLSIRDVRDRLIPTLPEGIELVDLHDVWLGAAPLAASVAAADYRILLDGAGPAQLGAAAADLLAAPALLRERSRGATAVSYDLRPLLGAIRVDTSGTTPVVALVRALFHPERGAGRPEEVVAALQDRLGAPLVAREIVRERIILADELDSIGSPVA
jgi:radical SAM-linked protein